MASGEGELNMRCPFTQMTCWSVYHTRIPSALSLLSHFGHFSGYNLHKSELFPMNEVASFADFSDLPFKVVKSMFTYQSITVTRKYKCLCKENFLSLLNKDKQGLVQRSLLCMSLVGKINSIKMFILPKFSPGCLSYTLCSFSVTFYFYALQNAQ